MFPVSLWGPSPICPILPLSQKEGRPLYLLRTRPFPDIDLGTSFSTQDRVGLQINTRIQGLETQEVPCSGAAGCPEARSFHAAQPSNRAEGSGQHPGPWGGAGSSPKPSWCEHKSQQLDVDCLGISRWIIHFLVTKRFLLSSKPGWHIACCLYKWTHPDRAPCCKCVIKGLKR